MNHYANGAKQRIVQLLDAELPNDLHRSFGEHIYMQDVDEVEFHNDEAILFIEAKRFMEFHRRKGFVINLASGQFKKLLNVAYGRPAILRVDYFMDENERYVQRDVKVDELDHAQYKIIALNESGKQLCLKHLSFPNAVKVNGEHIGYNVSLRGYVDFLHHIRGLQNLNSRAFTDELKVTLNPTIIGLK